MSFFTVDVTITYEVLFDILRREKDNNELQGLEDSFYDEVAEYLEEKRDTVQSSRTSAYTPSSEYEKQKIQLRNIVRTVKEIYNIRERKIVALARSKARSEASLIDTTKLLVDEQPLFDDSVELFRKQRKEVLEDALGKKPIRSKEQPKAPDNEDAVSAIILKDLPKFLGPDKKVYGPFEEGSDVEIPQSVAELLERKGRAELV